MTYITGICSYLAIGCIVSLLYILLTKHGKYFADIIWFSILVFGWIVLIPALIIQDIMHWRKTHVN